MKISLLPFLILNLQAGSFFEWAGDEFEPAEIENVSISGPGADPDKDGMSNLLEYALGTDPLYPDAHDGSIVLKFANGQVSFEFKRDTSKTDVRLIVQKSTDLKTWAPVPSEVLSSKKGLEKRKVNLPMKSRACFRFYVTR